MFYLDHVGSDGRLLFEEVLKMDLEGIVCKRKDSAPKYLQRDRDGIYGSQFRKQVEVMNINEVLSAPRSPWRGAYVERLIGSIRRECLDHVIILTRSRCAARCVHIFCITTGPAFISPWIKSPPVRAPSSQSGESTPLPKLAGCITATSASLKRFRLQTL